MSNVIKGIVLNIIQKYKLEECLHFDKKSCSGDIINAHSIQNNRILDKISKDGHVMMFSYDLDINDMAMKRIGRKIATTFSGFCQYHDVKVFQPIESYDYDPTNQEQNCLFAYRALIKELYAKKRLYQIQLGIFAYVDNDTNIALLKGSKKGLEDLEYCLNKFKDIIENKKFGKIKNTIIELDKDYQLAVCGAVNIEYDIYGLTVNNLHDHNEKPKPLFVNIFPQNNKTYIILSVFEEDEDIYSFLKSIETHEDKFTILTNLILCIENIAISPDRWDNFSEDKKSKIINTFKSNIISSTDPNFLTKDLEGFFDE
ncbi:hypothetical protein M0R01_01820 [bacterium]|nr:hypothetical protein [bacterium]